MERVQIMRAVLELLNKAKFEILAPEMVQMVQSIQKFANLILEMEKENVSKPE